MSTTVPVEPHGIFRCIRIREATDTWLEVFDSTGADAMLVAGVYLLPGETRPAAERRLRAKLLHLGYVPSRAMEAAS